MIKGFNPVIKQKVKIYNIVAYEFEFCLSAFGTTSFCLDTKGSKKSRSFEELSCGALGTFRQSPQCHRFGKAFVQLAEASNIPFSLRGILINIEIFLTQVPAKYPPYAFTENGILMLSSVLKSGKADKV
jgi:hypothetical protein